MTKSTDEIERLLACLVTAQRLLTECEPCHEEDCEHFDSSDPQPCSCGVGQWFIDRAKLEEAIAGPQSDATHFECPTCGNAVPRGQSCHHNLIG